MTMEKRDATREIDFRNYATVVAKRGKENINDPIVDKYVKDIQTFCPMSRERILMRIGLIPYSEEENLRIQNIARAEERY